MPRLVALERPETLTAAVVRALTDAIVRGDFAPGSPLPEAALSRQLTTSRGTVREALRALEDLGLVETFPHRGAFVTELTPRRAQEIFELRALLEAHAARSAALQHRFTEDAMADLEADLDALRQAASHNDLAAMVEADMAFHRRLSVLSGQELLLSHLDSLQAQTRRFIAAVKWYYPDVDEMVRTHEPIWAALQTQDPETVATAVTSHIIDAGHRLLSKLSNGRTQNAATAMPEPFDRD